MTRKGFSYIGFVFGLLVSVGWAGPDFERVSEFPEALNPAQQDAGLVTWGETTTRALSFSTIRVVSREGRARVEAKQSRFVFRVGAPELPVQTLRIHLPAGKRPRVSLANLDGEVSSRSLDLLKVPEAKVWKKGFHLNFSPEPRGRFFPGRFLKTAIVGDFLTVQLFPVQWDRLTNRLFVLRNADLKVQWQDDARSFLVPEIFGNAGMILTSEKLLDGARALQKFHAEKLGLKSDLVTVETIEQTEIPVNENDLPDGYKDSAVAESWVAAFNPTTGRGYNYLVARKITHFLQKRMNLGSPLKYVTILGDALVVPPSYYFILRADFAPMVTATDQCYAAKRQCLDPQFAVGRLPFSNNEQVMGYLEKAKGWLKSSVNAKTELSLYGGKAFPEMIYTGELGVIQTLQIQDASWRGVKKYFRTKRNYSKATVAELVSGKTDSAFVYYLDHGGGNRIYVEDEYITSKEIEALPASSTNPLVVSIMCTNAAYDETLSLDPGLFDADESEGERSVGVSLLRSPAGAVAYLGSARPVMGNPAYEIDRFGNLELKGTNYSLQLLNTFFDKYHAERRGRLGDILLLMNRAFLFEQGNDLSDERNLWTYFASVLLGDPALMLPERKGVERAFGLAKSTTPFEKLGLGIPSFTGLNLKLSLSTATEVLASLIRPGTAFEGEDTIVSEQSIAVGSAALTDLKLEKNGTHFLRLENTQGVPQERQVWFDVH